MAKKKYSDESLFCVKYLQDKGYLSQGDLSEMSALLEDFKVDFKMIKVQKNYYTELAEKLRELWPSGSKDGKYPWRDSVDNLAIRLKGLWEARGLKQYSVDDVLMVARQYLAEHENDTKYMKTLKNFIYKHKPTSVDSFGKVKMECDSTLADMLESLTEEQRQQNEFEALFNSSQFEQGTII